MRTRVRRFVPTRGNTGCVDMVKTTGQRALIGAIIVLSVGVVDARIICWTDDNGRRACGDVVPPHISAREQHVISSRGVVVETRARPPTESERQAQAEATLREAELAANAQREAAYDRFLLQTYRDRDELEEQGRRRLEALDGRQVLAEKALADTVAAVTDLQSRKSELEANGRPVPGRLITQLQTFEADLAVHETALAAITAQQDTLRARYAADLERFDTLQLTTKGSGSN